MVVEVLNKTLIINVPSRGLYGEQIYENTSYSMPMAVTEGHSGGFSCSFKDQIKHFTAKDLQFQNNIK